MRLFKDRLGKVLFRELLSPYAEVSTGEELLPDSLEADVLARLHKKLPANLPGAARLPELLNKSAALIEPYSDAIQPDELHGALAKLDLVLMREKRKPSQAGAVIEGCLLLLTPENSKPAILGALGEADEELEDWLWKWNRRHPVYLLRTDLAPDTPETLAFRLLSKGKKQIAALAEVWIKGLEPYWTVLKIFYRKVETMLTKEETKQELNTELLEELREMLKIREEVWIEIGKEKGIEEGIEKGIEKGEVKEARRMLLSLGKNRFGEKISWIEAWIASQTNLEILEKALLELAFSANLEDCQTRLSALESL